MRWFYLVNREGETLPVMASDLADAIRTARTFGFRAVTGGAA